MLIKRVDSHEGCDSRFATFSPKFRPSREFPKGCCRKMKTTLPPKRNRMLMVRGLALRNQESLLNRRVTFLHKNLLSASLDFSRRLQ